MTKAYWVVSVDVRDGEGYKLYIAENAKAFRKYGGRFLARGDKSEIVEGGGRSRNVLIEFPDYAAALACYRSPEYATALDIRRDKATADVVIVEGYEGPQPTDAQRPGGGGRAVVVTGGSGYRAEQGSDYRPGVSAESAGSQALWLGVATLPPGQRTRAHVHERHETAFYMLEGDGLEMWTGDNLQHRDVVRPGDYLYIPANVLHVAVNRGSKPAVFLGARNEPTAQESVVLRPEMDALVP
jgi:uncharacterized RmlC-like cupin family protein/uncharacterized protein (DUF1330 family)